MCWSVLIEMDDYIREGESMNHNEFIKFNGCLWLWVHTSAVVTAIFHEIYQCHLCNGTYGPRDKEDLDLAAY